MADNSQIAKPLAKLFKGSAPAAQSSMTTTLRKAIMTFTQYIEKLYCLQGILWIREERLVNIEHCIARLDTPDSNEFFQQYRTSGMFRQAVQNIMFGLQNGSISTGPYG